MKKISTSYFLLIICILPYIMPIGLQTFPIANLIFKLKYIAAAISLVIVFNKGKLKKNGVLFASWLFTSVMFIITYQMHGDVAEAVRRQMDFLIPIILFEYMIGENEKATLNWLRKYYLILACINLLIEIFISDGIVETVSTSTNKTYLLGIDNKISFVLLPLLAIALYYIERFTPESRKRKERFLYVAVFSSNLIVIWAANGVVMMAVFLILCYFMYSKKNLSDMISLQVGVVAIALMCYLVVFTDFFQRGVFADFIVGVLHKEVSFSGRTTLWAQVIKMLYKSPIYGYGIGSDVVNNFSFNARNGILSGFSTHNGYLRILLEGGIICLVLYAHIFIALGKCTKKIWQNNRCIRILSYGIISTMMGYIFEAEYFGASFLFLIALAHYYSVSAQNETLVEDNDRMWRE